MNGHLPRVAVVGGTYLDIAMKCNSIPVGGQSCCGGEFNYSVTGPGPRQAIQAANCGCKVHLISKVGGGPFGDAARMNLEEYKVNTDYVYTAEAMHTGVMVTLVDADGENAGCEYEGASSAMLAREIELSEDVINDADVCLIHGRVPNEVIVEAIKLAKLSKTKTIFNPAKPIEADSVNSELPLECFSVDFIIPNLYEAADITEQSSANIRTAKMVGSDLVARGVGTAIITMGKRGCIIVDREHTDHVPAFEVELVDQTGCGDAFAGALAAYFAVKDDIRKGVEFASAAGALACTKFGSLEAIPTKAEIIELLQQQP